MVSSHLPRSGNAKIWVSGNHLCDRGKGGFNDDLSRWDVSNVQNMQDKSIRLEHSTSQLVSGMSPRWRTCMPCFMNLEHSANQLVNGMSLRLRTCDPCSFGAVFNQPSAGWDVSKVENGV